MSVEIETFFYTSINKITNERSCMQTITAHNDEITEEYANILFNILEVDKKIKTEHFRVYRDSLDNLCITEYY